jgi:hypothetical protein
MVSPQLILCLMDALYGLRYMVKVQHLA